MDEIGISFGNLLADARREDFPLDVDEVPDAKDEYDYTIPEADTTMLTAIVDHQREEADAKYAMDTAIACTREVLARERAAAKQEEDDGAYAERLQAELKDERCARTAQRSYDREVNTAEFEEKPSLDRDALYARAVEDACKADLAAERAEAEAKDGAGAVAYQRRLDRQDHRLRRDRQAANESKEDGATVGERWANALAKFELEDVGGAIVISLRLPDLVAVSVKPVDTRFVLLQASRSKPFGQRSNTDGAEDGPMALKLRLELESPGCKLRQRDLSYDYCSTSGYLHIYCENLKLATLGATTPERKTAVSDLRKRLVSSVRDHAARVSDKVRGNAAHFSDKVRSAVTRAPTRRIDAV